MMQLSQGEIAAPCFIFFHSLADEKKWICIIYGFHLRPMKENIATYSFLFLLCRSFIAIEIFKLQDAIQNCDMLLNDDASALR